MTEHPDSSPDADDLIRRLVGDWSDAKLVMVGTDDEIAGDGLTMRLDNLQPGGNAVCEVVVDDETIARLVNGEDEGRDEDSEENNEKGARNEREAKDILGRVYGRGHVDRVSAYANTDPLGFIDLLASKQQYPTRFVQVKTNSFSPKQQRQYAQRASRFPEHVEPEVWVRKDYVGWRMYRLRDGEWEVYVEMDTCDLEETVEAFREAVGFYDE